MELFASDGSRPNLVTTIELGLFVTFPLINWLINSDRFISNQRLLGRYVEKNKTGKNRERERCIMSVGSVTPRHSYTRYTHGYTHVCKFGRKKERWKEREREREREKPTENGLNISVFSQNIHCDLTESNVEAGGAIQGKTSNLFREEAILWHWFGHNYRSNGNVIDYGTDLQNESTRERTEP